MPCQGLDGKTGSQLPYPDCMIRAGSGDASTILTECGIPYVSLVSTECEDFGVAEFLQVKPFPAAKLGAQESRSCSALGVLLLCHSRSARTIW